MNGLVNGWTAVRVHAPMDRNGNSRIGWMMQHHWAPLAQVFVLGDGSGYGAVCHDLNMAPWLARKILNQAWEVNVTAAEFRRLKSRWTLRATPQVFRTAVNGGAFNLEAAWGGV